MLKQSGFAHIVLVSVFLLAIAVVIATSLLLIQNKNKQDSPSQSNTSAPTPSSSQPEPAIEEGKIRVYGEVTFARQGPTDNIVGYDPQSATLALLTEAQLRTWQQNSPVSEDSFGQLREDTRPEGSQIIKTPVGSYEVVVERDSDVLCLLQPIGTLDRKTEYDVHSCKKFVTKAKELKANIGLIGFGHNEISCEEPVCIPVQIARN